jgi:hypothetical protein
MHMVIIMTSKTSQYNTKVQQAVALLPKRSEFPQE